MTNNNYNISDKKDAIRLKYLLKRANFSGEQKEEADRNIFQKLLSFQPYLAASKVCYYLSKEVEVSTIEIIKKELAIKEKIIIVPKVEKKGLTLFQIKSWDDLELGCFGIWEPKKNNHPVDPKEVDLFIIPGVVFDRLGNRIGWGRAYYDKILKLSSAIKVGLAYDFQVIDNVPVDPHDARLNYIITEKKIYHFQ